MKKRKVGMALSLVLAAGTLLGACGGKEEKEKGAEKEKDNFAVAMVTDVGGIDDKSFNQSAWEGLQAYGKEAGLEKGSNGYDYLQSKSDADYTTNLNTLVRKKFDLVFGIGFLMGPSIEEIADQQKDAKFAIIDAEVKKDNVESVLFKEHEGSFLAGVAAVLTSKSGKIGFVGGMQIPVIERFESGFAAGVKAANKAYGKNVQLEIVYTGAFDKAELGQQTASKMFSSGADVIFHAAGGTGMGVFTEAKNLKKKSPDKDFWVIGVDRDQTAEGAVEVNGEQKNVTLTSMIKRVDNAVAEVSKKAAEGNFSGGTSVQFGIKEKGVGLAESANLTDDVKAKVKEWEDKIVDGSVVVPADKKELAKFEG